MIGNNLLKLKIGRFPRTPQDYPIMNPSRRPSLQEDRGVIASNAGSKRDLFRRDPITFRCHTARGNRVTLFRRWATHFCVQVAHYGGCATQIPRTRSAGKHRVDTVWKRYGYRVKGVWIRWSRAKSGNIPVLESIMRPVITLSASNKTGCGCQVPDHRDIAR